MSKTIPIPEKKLSKMCIRLSCGFNETRNFSTDFKKIVKYKMPLRSVRWEGGLLFHADMPYRHDAGNRGLPQFCESAQNCGRQQSAASRANSKLQINRQLGYRNGVGDKKEYLSTFCKDRLYLASVVMTCHLSGKWAQELHHLRAILRGLHGDNLHATPQSVH